MQKFDTWTHETRCAPEITLPDRIPFWLLLDKMRKDVKIIEIRSKMFANKMIQLNELQQALQDKPQWHQSTRRSSNAMLCAQLLTCWWCSSVAISVWKTYFLHVSSKRFFQISCLFKVIVWHVQCLYLYYLFPMPFTMPFNWAKVLHRPTPLRA